MFLFLIYVIIFIRIRFEGGKKKCVSEACVSVCMREREREKDREMVDQRRNLEKERETSVNM